MKNFQFSIFNFQKFLIILLVVPSFAYAFSAQVVVDTDKETINAIEGTLEIPSGVSISDIYIGDSTILFWIVMPVLNPETNTIFFAGLTPGGFRGRYSVFSIAGDFEPADLSEVKFSDINALKNDGSGTAVSVKLKLIPGAIVEDTTPPESFEPSISSSPDIFEGRRFLSFVTQDKGVGIDRYEYASTWFLSPKNEEWVTAESPLVLSRLETFKKIHIRAIDKAGNYRIMSTASLYYYYLLLFGVIILLCVLLLSRRFVRSRS